MPGLLRWLEARGDAAARLAAMCSIASLIALALMTIADVMMRWLFNAPIDGVADIGSLVAAIAVAATFPYAVAARHHITIGFLGALLSRRWQALLGAFASLVTTLFFALFAWQFVLYVFTLDHRGQTTWVLQLPVAPWWAVVAAFMTLCALLQAGVMLATLCRGPDAGAGAEGADGPGRREGGA